MDKAKLLQLILAKLQEDFQAAQRAALDAHDAATHEESVAENKYDTRGLEASYLAAGISRRVREIEVALTAYQNLALKAFDDDSAVQLTALVQLESSSGLQRTLFLGPDAAGLKLNFEGQEVLVITPKSPMGEALIGKMLGDDIHLQGSPLSQRFEIVGLD